MYCPKCGQSQLAEEMRFCSRCGFQLDGVSALMLTGGIPSALTVQAIGESRLAGKRGSRLGVKLMCASGVLAPFAMGLAVLVDSPLPLILPLTIFLLGLACVYYFRLFGEDAGQVLALDSMVQQSGAKGELLLQPQKKFASFKPTHRTAEIVQPSSVTEHTTKLLDESKLAV